MLVIIGLLASANVLAFTTDTVFKESINHSILSTTNESKLNALSISVPNENKAHQHGHMSSSSDSKSNHLDKNCKCCEFGGCASCIGCSGSCGTATFAAASNCESANAPLGRFVQMQAIYASLSPTPLEHPPK